MKIDITNLEWEEFEELPKKQKIKPRLKIKKIEPENSFEIDIYEKMNKRDAKRKIE
jgi:hypothetical protein